MTIAFFAFYRTCGLDQITQQQEFFGNGSLTGIGMRDDGKGSSSFDFVELFFVWHLGFFKFVHGFVHTFESTLVSLLFLVKSVALIEIDLYFR